MGAEMGPPTFGPPTASPPRSAADPAGNGTSSSPHLPMPPSATSPLIKQHHAATEASSALAMPAAAASGGANTIAPSSTVKAGSDALGPETTVPATVKTAPAALADTQLRGPGAAAAVSIELGPATPRETAGGGAAAAAPASTAPASAAPAAAAATPAPKPTPAGPSKAPAPSPEIEPEPAPASAGKAAVSADAAAAAPVGPATDEPYADAVDGSAAATAAAATAEAAVTGTLDAAALEAEEAELAAAVKKKKESKPSEPWTLTLNTLVAVLLGLWLACVLGLAWWLKPSWWFLSTFFVAGAGFGLAFNFVYYLNCKAKAEVNQTLSSSLGLKGMQYVVGTLPSWLSYTEMEKMEWLNAILVEVWPFVDKAVCKEVKKQVESVMADMLRTQKVPIKAIGFKQLTFGDAPFRVESVWVNEHIINGCLELEMDVRWCGDANITLAVELTGAGGEFTKMCPQVTDISFVATLKVRLGPLCDKIPGFGAISFSFKKPPRIKYHMNVGKALGGGLVSSVVKPFINSIIKTQVNALLVWPQRMIIPLPLPDLLKNEAIMRGVLAMNMLYKGVLKVEVIRAEGLKAADWVLAGEATSDPFVELTTDGKYTARTKVVKKNLAPRWEQTFWLLVQEPDSQEMQVTVLDWDLAGDADILGYALVKLAPITKITPNAVTQWYHLGMGDWSDPGGCGKGFGRIQLKLMYRSCLDFAPNEAKDAIVGVLVVRVRKVSGMALGRKPTTLYCMFYCNDEEFETAAVTAKGGGDHIFTFKNSWEFHNVRFDTDVKVSVFEKALGNEEMGFVELPITDIAEAMDPSLITGTPMGGNYVRELKLDESDSGHISLVIRYLPYY